jgi:CheY-like chemotaxis protein
MPTRPRILIADDDEAVRHGFRRVLERRYDVDEAANGAEVIARIEAGETFDVLLLDVEMPLLNGQRTLERLAVIAPELARRTLVVTGGPWTEERQRWLEGLPKGRAFMEPVDLATLIASIERVLAAP